MAGIKDYIDENGNFIQQKIAGTKEQIFILLEQYKETEIYKSMPDSQKILMEWHVFPRIIETGMVPNGLLLEIVMPSSSKPKAFSEMEIGEKIKFELPPKYKKKRQ